MGSKGNECPVYPSECLMAHLQFFHYLEILNPIFHSLNKHASIISFALLLLLDLLMLTNKSVTHSLLFLNSLG